MTEQRRGDDMRIKIQECLLLEFICCLVIVGLIIFFAVIGIFVCGLLIYDYIYPVVEVGKGAFR